MRNHPCRAERMAMPALQHPEFWTAEMVLALPDDGMRHETVHGELFVTPSPRLWHQIVLDNLADQLKLYLRREPVGRVIDKAADISWAPDVLVQPDLFVAPLSELRTLNWAQVKSLILVVEVLSRSTTRADRFAKRRVYQEVGIPLYWIVDADRHQVEVWTPEALEPVIERERLQWRPEGAGAPCVVELGGVFRAV